MSDRDASGSAAENLLSPREAEVLQQLLDGRSEAATARRLGISPHTVRAHVRNIYLKLEVHSRLQLATSVLSSRHTTQTPEP